MLVAALILAPPLPAAAESPAARELYARALEREQELRDADPQPALPAIRRAVQAYDAIVRRYPTSGYSDNALWQGANLAMLAYRQLAAFAHRRRACASRSGKAGGCGREGERR
jgi:hypothetical protein